MKRCLRLLLVMCTAAFSLAVQCHKPDPPEPPDPPVVILDTSYDVSPEGGTVTITLNMNETWTAKVTGGGKWCTINKKSGGTGEFTLVIRVARNDTYQSRQCQVSVTSSHSCAKIAINQAQQDVLSASPSQFDVEAEGGVFEVVITANVTYEVSVSEDWITWEEGVITVGENTLEEGRTATITLASETLSYQITIVQDGVEPPPQVDELDGVVTVLQPHSEGAGIPLVLMGDAFSREEIEDGTYEAVMSQAADCFFALEPYASFRNLFDLYMVNVVSGYYDDFSVPGSTTLGTYFGTGTYVGGDLDKCREYTLKAIKEDELDNSLVIVLLNRAFHAGRTYMSFVTHGTGDIPDEEKMLDDCARGVAYSLLALGNDDADFASLIGHEAGGHGFGKLADEYSYDYMGAIPKADVDNFRSIQTLHHAYMNVDFTSEPEDILWAHILGDERYAGEDVGIFEGGCVYPQGVFRSSENSIMNDNTGGFNAVSREAIFYRMHKLAYGKEWEYDYEDFAAYDAVNRGLQPSAYPSSFSLFRRRTSYSGSTVLR